MQTDIELFFKKNRSQYNEIQQNSLMSESQLLRFSKERGIAVSSAIPGDPGFFLRKGWITSDTENNGEADLFHPFRLYPLHIGLQLCKLNISASSSLQRDNFKDFLAKVCDDFLPPIEIIEKEIQISNEIINLAILLEPIYWPIITSRTSYSTFLNYVDFELKQQKYKEKILLFIETLDPNIWSKHHQTLRLDAARLDDNHDLYLLLRSAPWKKREQIKGNIGHALWIRHIAELIRLGFEEVHNCDWDEEDSAFDLWNKTTRALIYGSERPIDNNSLIKPYLSFEFGLHTGSTIRWYLEGETEYYAATYALPKADSLGIELINLKGAVGTEKANAALRLTDNVINDLALRRFSFISFDSDVAANVKAIRKLVEDNSIVGYVNCNIPDFEFGNFTNEELLDILISMDEKEDADTNQLKNGEFKNIKNGRELEQYYKTNSKIGQKGLKGKKWGSFLAQYALEHPYINNNEERPFIKTLQYVIQAQNVRYEIQRDKYKLVFTEPNIFEIDKILNT